MGRLTQRESEVLEFIKDFMKENGRTPDMREIGIGMKIYSLNTVHTHFHNLVDKGYIEQEKTKYTVKGMRYIEDENT